MTHLCINVDSGYDILLIEMTFIGLYIIGNLVSWHVLLIKVKSNLILTKISNRMRCFLKQNTRI